jgi:Zn-dependent protease
VFLRRSRSLRLLVGHWDGIPIHADWTLLLGVLVVAGFAGLTASTWFGYVLVILVHELGHAALVRRYGFHPTLIFLHGFGGECEYEGDPTAREVSAIAWGGVLGQAVLFAAVFLPIHFGLVPPAVTTSGFAAVTIGSNVFIAAFNLLPISGLDGEHAWRLFRNVPSERTAKPKLTPTEIADELVRKAVRAGRRDSRR